MGGWRDGVGRAEESALSFLGALSVFESRLWRWLSNSVDALAPIELHALNGRIEWHARHFDKAI